MIGNRVRDTKMSDFPLIRRFYCLPWKLLGRLGFKEHNGETDFISYTLKQSYAGFVSPEEMAKLVNIDVQRRKPRKLYKGIHAYDYVSANGKTFGVSIDNEGGRFAVVRISNFEIGGEVTEHFKPTQVVDLPSMIGVASGDTENGRHSTLGGK